MLWIQRNHFQIECTGRKIYAFAETFGLVDDDEGNPCLTYGYDGHVSEARVHLDGTPDEAGREVLTLAERTEIADYMIARWTAWKREI